MAFCSAVTLCFASIFSLAAAALLAIAFSTDNWQTISVNKNLNAAVTSPKDIALIMVGNKFLSQKVAFFIYHVNYHNLNYTHKSVST